MTDADTPLSAEERTALGDFGFEYGLKQEDENALRHALARLERLEEELKRAREIIENERRYAAFYHAHQRGESVGRADPGGEG